MTNENANNAPSTLQQTLLAATALIAWDLPGVGADEVYCVEVYMPTPPVAGRVGVHLHEAAFRRHFVGRVVKAYAYSAVRSHLEVTLGTGVVAYGGCEGVFTGACYLPAAGPPVPVADAEPPRQAAATAAAVDEGG